MGCGNSYKGGRCLDKSNPENCVYSTINEEGSEMCAGSFKLLQVPTDNLCKDQRGLYKCVKTKYENQDECKKSCPGSCKNLSCKVSIGTFSL